MTNHAFRRLRQLAGEVNLGLVPVLALAPISVTIIFLYLSLKVSILVGLGVLGAFAAPVSYYIYRREQESMKALTSPGGWVSKKKREE